MGRISTFLWYAITIVSISQPTKSQSSGNSVTTPNRYVQSSPPCIAAVCKDGISIVALHTNIQTNPYTTTSNDPSNNNYAVDDDNNDNCKFSNLPFESRNPLRIERIDEKGSALVTCGWRTDGMILADVARDLCRDEVMRYGKRESSFQIFDGDDNDDDENGRTKNAVVSEEYYGRWLGWGLVKYLVRSEVRESVRSLSTIGLLATANKSNGGDLHLIDSTGITKCRAYAIGKHSTQLNERLMYEDFQDLTVEQGMQKLVEILEECSNGESARDREEDVDNNNVETWNLPKQTFLEMLVVDSRKSRIRRLRQPLS